MIDSAESRECAVQPGLAEEVAAADLIISHAGWITHGAHFVRCGVHPGGIASSAAPAGGGEHVYAAPAPPRPMKALSWC